MTPIPDSATLLIDTPITRENLTRYYAEITYMDNQVKQCLEYLIRTGNQTTRCHILERARLQFPHCKWTCYDTA